MPLLLDLVSKPAKLPAVSQMFVLRSSNLNPSFQIKDLCTVIIPMREISVVEKMDSTSILPNALHITIKSKVVFIWI